MHDFTGIDRLIQRTPSRLTPMVLLGLANFFGGKAEEGLASQMLTRARREMQKTQVERPHFFIEIVNVFAKLLPSEAPDVFREAMLGLNNVPPPDPQPEWPRLPLSHQLQPVVFNPDVIKLDADYLRAATGLLDSPADRVTIRLGLLGPALRQYAQARKSARQEKRRSAK